LRLCGFAFQSFSSRLSRSTLTLLVSNGGGALLSFALSVIIGRALGEEGLGIYAAALAWIFPLGLLADFGLETLITREVAQNPDAAPAYLRAAALARLALGGLLLIVLILIAPLLTDNPVLVRGLQLSAPLIVIGPFVSAFTAVFRARQVMWPSAVLNIGMLLAQVALTAWALLRGGDVLLALAINTATSAGQLAAAWTIYRTWFAHLTHGGAPLHMSALLRQAWPFALAGVLAALQMRLNLILLERIAGAAEAGQYAAASRLIEAGRMLPNALFGALFPALAALSADAPALNRLFRRVMAGLAAYGLLTAGGALLFSGWIIDLTYGAAFEPAAQALALLALALLPGLLKGAFILYAYSQGRESDVNRVLAVSLGVQAALGLWLIDRHGAAGAALALLAAECVALILLRRRI
jgi:O-antigen/teichoic acid export membrane protein